MNGREYSIARHSLLDVALQIGSGPRHAFDREQTGQFHLGSEQPVASETSTQCFVVSARRDREIDRLCSSSRRSERERWIREKYEQKLFLAPLTLSTDQTRQALLEAILNEDLPTVILLLAHGKIPTDDLNASFIHLAASQGNMPILQLLLWVTPSS